MQSQRPARASPGPGQPLSAKSFLITNTGGSTRRLTWDRVMSPRGFHNSGDEWMCWAFVEHKDRFCMMHIYWFIIAKSPVLCISSLTPLSLRTLDSEIEQYADDHVLFPPVRLEGFLISAFPSRALLTLLRWSSGKDTSLHLWLLIADITICDCILMQHVSHVVFAWSVETTKIVCWRWKCLIYRLIFYLCAVEARLPWGSGKWRRNKAQSEKTLPCFHMNPFDVPASGDLDIISCPSSKRHQTRCCIQNQITVSAWAKMCCVCAQLHAAYIYTCLALEVYYMFFFHMDYSKRCSKLEWILCLQNQIYDPLHLKKKRKKERIIILLLKMKRRSCRQCLYSWIAIFSLASAGTMHNYISTATMQKEYYISSGPL